MQSRRAVLGAALGGMIGLAGVAWTSNETQASGHHLGFTSVPTRRTAVALSFDDGPDPRFTAEVLDVLAAHGAQATFFVVGVGVAAHPALVRRIVAEGHEVANHTLGHERLDRLARAEVRAQLEGGAAAIAALGLGPAARPRLVRAPYGFEGPASRAELLAGSWEVARWRGCLEHHLTHDPPGTAGPRMAAAARPGDVLLAHDGGAPDRGPSLAALPGLLTALAARHLLVTSIGGLQAA
ncbi:MAG: polysaccharide deacetylase family protein [Acidimicrobiales bacterium]